jgi:hypothetical protein
VFENLTSSNCDEKDERRPSFGRELGPPFLDAHGRQETGSRNRESRFRTPGAATRHARGCVSRLLKTAVRPR